MQAFVAVLLVCVALGSADVKVNREEAKKLYSECKAKTGATESEEDFLDKEIIPTTEAGKCLIECVLSTQGALKDGKIDIENSKKLAEKFSEPGELDKHLKTIEECANKSYEGLDKCSFATAYYECSINKLKEKKK